CFMVSMITHVCWKRPGGVQPPPMRRCSSPIWKMPLLRCCRRRFRWRRGPQAVHSERSTAVTKTRDLKEKYGPWALVTGASSGIGEQFARLLARSGMNLLLVARRGERLESLAQELRRRRRLEVELVVADLAEPDAVDRVVAAVGERDLGLVVSNAGFGLKGDFAASERAR